MFCLQCWLTRLEDINAIPSIHKLLSLGAIYRVRIAELLPIFGIYPALLQRYEMETAPDRTQLVQFEEVEPESRVAFLCVSILGFRVEETNLLSGVIQVWGEVPVTLLQNLDIQRGLYGFIGLNDYTIYPLLRPGVLC
jgi:hypothetical protein